MQFNQKPPHLCHFANRRGNLQLAVEFFFHERLILWL
jgi:hypothetical protein